MAHLVVHKDALAHNIRTVAARCRSMGADLMLVFKEAGIRPELLQFMLDVGACTRVGVCHFPTISLPRPAHATTHLLYLVPDSSLAAAAATYDTVYQTGLHSMRLLAQHAAQQGRVVRVVLPVELGDGRDGVLPEHIVDLATEMASLRPHLELFGLSANFACISERAPSLEDLHQLLQIQAAVERRAGFAVSHISVGGSDILALGEASPLPRGISEIRCGTAVYLGVYPLDDRPVSGLQRTAVRLCGQVMECTCKNGRLRAVFDFGTSDTTPDLVSPPHEGMILQGASSGYSIFDVTDCAQPMACGDSMLFGLHHRSLARALASPRVPLCME